MRRVASVRQAEHGADADDRDDARADSAAASTASSVIRSGPTRNSSCASGSGLWPENTRFVNAHAQRRQGERRESPGERRQRDRPELETRNEHDDGQDERRSDVDASGPCRAARRRAIPSLTSGLVRPRRLSRWAGPTSGANRAALMAVSSPTTSSRDDPALGQLDPAVGGVADEPLVVGRGEEGAPLPDQLVERRDQRLVAAPILAVRRLVEGEEQRSPREPGHEREPALFAAGEPVRAPIPEGLQRQPESLAQLARVGDLLRSRPSSTSSCTESARNPSSGSWTT